MSASLPSLNFSGCLSRVSFRVALLTFIKISFASKAPFMFHLHEFYVPHHHVTFLFAVWLLFYFILVKTLNMRSILLTTFSVCYCTMLSRRSLELIFHNQNFIFIEQQFPISPSPTLWQPLFSAPMIPAILDTSCKWNHHVCLSVTGSLQLA